MNRTFKIYLIIFIGVIILLVVLQMGKTEILNWKKTFDIESKSPFGLLIFNEQADELFNQKLERIHVMPYEYFAEDSSQENQNILLINPQITEEGWNKILSRVEQGDNVFYMDYDLPNEIQYNLKIDLNRYYHDPEYFVFTDPQFEKDSLYIHSLSGKISISKINSENTRILGFEENHYSNRNTNFIGISHGKGIIFIHTEPMVVTNYHLLEKNDFNYVENIFSYLPDQKTIWFQPKQDEIISSSPLRFILSNKALRNAWYLTLFSVVLFIIFHSKRRQRIIPIIEPLPNTSAEFVRTIGNLYLQEGNYKDMANKKATYFLARLRTEFLMDTKSIDETFKHRLEQKTAAKPEDINKLMPLLIKSIHPDAPVQENELIEFNRLIDKILQPYNS